MAQANPELIFLTGPQQGRRSVIMTSPAVAGRVASCDLHLSEEFVSRQQFSLELTVDGWVMENLSVNGTRVNGKRFKAGKKVLLDSGDVLRMGRDTEILFVAPGDDPDMILAEHRSANPVQAPAPRAPAAEAPRDQPQSEPSSPAPPPEEPAEEMTEEQKLTKAKIRKYVIFGIVWGIGLVVLIAVLVMMRGGDGPIKRARPAKLSKRQIEEMLREDIGRDKNLQEAAERLTKAIGKYGTGKWFREGELQNCVKNFKLHLAYLGRPDFEDPKHSLMYKDARRKLIREVQDRYREAWIMEQDRQWAAADEGWQILMRVIPRDPEWDTPGYDKLQRDIMAHASYARRYLRKR